MDDDDPFAEPGDSDKTVIRPNPGGRRAGLAQPASAPQAYAEPAPAAVPASSLAAPPPAADAVLEDSLTGVNPLVASAGTLFALISRIRNRAQHPDPDALRRSVVGAVRSFETHALQKGCDPQAIKVARYAICATIDDLVLNTPWGGTSGWSTQSLVSTFHREVVGGDRFYDLLARLEQDPARNIDLLEFLYMCLSLGFEGRLRVEQGGADRHLQVREGLAQIIRRQRGEPGQDLSPHWPGVVKPFRALSLWKPFWIAVAATVALLGAGFMGLSWALSSETGRLLGAMSTLESGPPPELARRAPPVPPPPPEVENTGQQLDRIKGFLKAEIDDGLVTVEQDATSIKVVMAGAGMFGSGSDVLKSGFETAIARVAEAVNDTKGPVLVVGHSDSDPIKTSRFPSNMHLSLARAESVRKLLAETVKQADRLSAEGRADREPLVPNDSAANKAKNRRIEIVLRRDGVPEGDPAGDPAEEAPAEPADSPAGEE
nr:type IVB secretion system protein IcmH/DotU [Pseudogemmobacter humi]